MPNNNSAWGMWWTLRYQINLGIFLNSQGYLKAIRLLACTKEAWASPGPCRVRQEDLVHLFSYDICLFQIKFTEASTSVLYHIPTMQKTALQMSSVFPVNTFSEMPYLSLHVLLTIPQEPILSNLQVPSLKASLEANSRVGQDPFSPTEGAVRHAKANTAWCKGRAWGMRAGYFSTPLQKRFPLQIPGENCWGIKMLAQ